MKIETVAEHCKHPDCVYRGHLASSNQYTVPCCDYILLEKRPRNCRISKCDKYKRGIRRNRINTHTYVMETAIEDISEEYDDEIIDI